MKSLHDVVGTAFTRATPENIGTVFTARFVVIHLVLLPLGLAVLLWLVL